MLACLPPRPVRGAQRRHAQGQAHGSRPRQTQPRPRDRQGCPKCAALLDQVLQPDRAAGLLNDDDYACLKREMFWVNRAFRRYRTVRIIPARLVSTIYFTVRATSQQVFSLA